MLNDLVRCIRMNLELGRKRPDRRKRLAGLELPTDERFLSSKHELVENGFAMAKVKLEQRHTRTVTQVTVFVKKFSLPTLNPALVDRTEWQAGSR